MTARTLARGLLAAKEATDVLLAAVVGQDQRIESLEQKVKELEQRKIPECRDL